MKFMKRLWVRLTLVGIVLAIGAVAIAQTTGFWNGDKPTQTAENDTKPAPDKKKDKPVKPIPRAEEPDVLQPPPSDAFRGLGNENPAVHSGYAPPTANQFNGGYQSPALADQQPVPPSTSGPGGDGSVPAPPEFGDSANYGAVAADRNADVGSGSLSDEDSTGDNPQPPSTTLQFRDQADPQSSSAAAAGAGDDPNARSPTYGNQGHLGGAGNPARDTVDGAGNPAGSVNDSQSTPPDPAGGYNPSPSPATSNLQPYGTAATDTGTGQPRWPGTNPAGLTDQGSGPSGYNLGTDTPSNNAQNNAPQNNPVQNNAAQNNAAQNNDFYRNNDGYGAERYGQNNAAGAAAPLNASAGTDPLLQPTPDYARGGYGEVPNDELNATLGLDQVAAHDMPGPKELEGLQTPALSLEKIAPDEIQVGRIATFQIRVRNTGRVAAHDVIVVDRVPQGAELDDASPDFTQSPDGALVWQLGTLEPGQETIIKMQLIPRVEGEIGSVAQVVFQAKASARSVSTRPQLQVTHAAPREVLIGKTLVLDISVTNIGSGIAEKVVLEEDVPEGLTHPAGKQLEYEIGSLRPGETRKLELVLTAEKAGLYQNRLAVRGEGNLMHEDQLEIEVTAPQLQLAVQGPTRRYLDRQATYVISVANPGTASATNVDLVAYMPKGFKFVETDNEGRYDPQSHAVHWSLEELPANRLGEVRLTTIPVETGEQMFRVEGRADLSLSQAAEKAVAVNSLSELTFSIADLADPIEQGSETTYEIRVRNQGAKTDTNILLAALLPADLQAVNVDGPTRGVIDGQHVQFEPVPRLAANSEVVYRFTVRGAQAGDHVIKVQVVSDESGTPVTKEESTRVYLDQ